MRNSLHEGYLEWLSRLVEDPGHRRSSQSHGVLFAQLHAKPFRWYVANDDNRAEDGRELRDEFLDTHDIFEHDNQWLNIDTSVLEMLIALARRVSFESYGTPDAWFWKLLENLALDRYTDAVYNDHVESEVDETLEKLLERQYGRDGTGGLFPLRYPSSDQRTTELWYQMSAYLLEGSDVDNGP